MSITTSNYWPTCKLLFECSTCGATAEVCGPVMNWESRRGHTELTVQVPERGLPEGWRYLEGKMYCQKHNVHLNVQVLIDGKVVEEKRH